MADETLDAPAERRFQFTLAGAFYVLTGAAVAMSCIVWHPAIGSVGAHLVVGSCWALLARRSGHRRLAYYLAASVEGTLGALVVLVSCVPLFFGMVGFRVAPWEISCFCLLMAVAAALSARVLGRMIRTWNPKADAGAPVLAIFLTALLFGWLSTIVYGLASAFKQGDIDIGAISSLGNSLLVSTTLCPALAFITMPVTLPLAMLFCWILGRIDPARAAEFAAAPKPPLDTGSPVQREHHEDCHDDGK